MKKRRGGELESGRNSGQAGGRASVLRWSCVFDSAAEMLPVLQSDLVKEQKLKKLRSRALVLLSLDAV